jgi:hypothetical protein
MRPIPKNGILSTTQSRPTQNLINLHLLLTEAINYCDH